jgi:glycosidase
VAQFSFGTLAILNRTVKGLVMKGPGRLLVFAALLLCAASPGLAQESLCSSSSGNAPCVDEVDPPNWWVGFPSPMLLLHGDHLTGATFSISNGSGAVLTKTQISANGHYAFLWLRTSASAPEKIAIRISSAAGNETVNFALRARSAEPHSGFSPSDVIYLIMTDRFADGDPSNDPRPAERSLARGWHGGDLRGIQNHLDYLQQLGVTTIWTTPVYDNDGGNQAYHGYSATNLYRVDPHFGTLDDLRALADALHRRGMKLVLDTVPNHVGAAHPWAFDPPTPDWFHGTRTDHHVNSDQFQLLLDSHATWEERRWVTEGWFANVLPDLNQENPLVRQYLIQNVIWWVESSGADGLRYDTFPYVGRGFWQSLDGELKTLYPRLTTVGEIFNPNPVITSYFAGGERHDGIDTGLTTPFDFPVYFALRSALTHRDPVPGGPVLHNDLRALEEVLQDDWLYPHPERLALFLGNHDTMRFMSQPGATAADLKIAFALLATLRGMPQIYSGDEIAMRGGDDPYNRQDFPGGFPGDKQNAFGTAGRTGEQAEVHDWAASLFQFRHRHPVLASGEQQDIFVDPTAFVFVRTADVKQGCGAGRGEHLLIAVNDSDESREIALDLEHTALAGCRTLTGALGSSEVFHASESHLSLTLPARQALVFSAK